MYSKYIKHQRSSEILGTSSQTKSRAHPRTTMTTETAKPPTSLPSTEESWADISDDEEDQVPETVKVDSIDLNKLSINDKEKSPTASTSKATGEPLAGHD